MARNDAKMHKTILYLQRYSFNLLLLLCMLIGVLFILVSINLKNNTSDAQQALIFRLGQMIPSQVGASTTDVVLKQKPLEDLIVDLLDNSHSQSIAPDIIRDVGIAIFISAFVTFVVEIHANDRLREHITYDVLEAAYAKVIPEKVYMQVADNIFRSNVYRRNWTVHIEPGSDHDIDRYDQRKTRVIVATYSYNVENLNERTIPFVVLASIDLDDPPPDPTANLPRFKLFEVKGERDQILAEVKENELLNKGMDKSHLIRNVTFERAGQRMQLSAQVRIPSRRSIAVRFEVEREIRVPGNYVLTANSPADGVTIIVSRAIKFNLGVVPLHPDSGALHHSPGSDTWQFDAAILPWQGVRFVSEPAALSPAPRS